MVEKQLNRFVFALEIAVSAALVVVAALLVLTLAFQLIDAITEGGTLARQQFTTVISTALEVFIVIELFRIALAYMNHRDVIPTVLEAALVAVARKFVVFEPKEGYLESALGLSALLVAIAVSWWLLSRARVLENPEEHPPKP